MLTGAQPGWGGSTVVVVVGGTVVVVVGGVVVVVGLAVVGVAVVGVVVEPGGAAELPVGLPPEQPASTATMPTATAAAPRRADRDRVVRSPRFQKSCTGDVLPLLPPGIDGNPQMGHS
jgi:hypothetical protein